MRVSERSPSEVVLIEHGVLSRHSREQAQVLGCLGCHWLRAKKDEYPLVCATQIAECTGLGTGTIVPILHRLEEGGAVVAETEVTRYGRGAHRIYYFPADTAAGDKFYETLEIPTNCA